MEPRLTAPDRDNPYYTKYSPYWQAGKGMPNCTAYSYGRINELKQVTSYDDALARTHLSRRNARKWWDENDGYARGQDPAPGAVAVFQGIARTPQGDTYGHVMVVEQVDGDTVTLSGSDAAVDGSSGRYFYVDTLTLDQMRDASYHGGLLGFIYAYTEVKETMSRIDGTKLCICDYCQYLSRRPSSDDIVNDTNLIQDQAMSTEEYDSTFINSEEYKQRHSTLECEHAIIDAYRIYLKRFPSEDEVAFQISALDSGNFRLRDLIWNIATSPECKKKTGLNIQPV